MDDTGIRTMKRWGVRVGELGMDYRELRIVNAGANLTNNEFEWSCGG